jgi:hypothetical protein
MPPILYARGETSSDGTRVSYTLTGPALLHPDGRGQEAIRKAEQAAVRAAGRQARTKAIGAYSPPAIKAGWELQTRTVGSILIEVRNPVPLARMVEEPTKPHEIVPHSKKALHWGGPGGDVFATRVHHPGTKGKGRLPGLLNHLASSFEAQITKRVTPLLQGDSAPTGEE